MFLPTCAPDNYPSNSGTVLSPKLPFSLFLALGLVCIPQLGHSQSATNTYTEQYKAIKAPGAVAKLGPDLFGDSVNLYNGTLEFVQTDVSLKGNSKLPVSMGRKIEAGRHHFDDRGFGRWTLDIPRMHGVFALRSMSVAQGWKGSDGSDSRCTYFGAPPEVRGLNGDSGWSADEFWQGHYLYIPGVGDQRLLSRDPGYTQQPGKLYLGSVSADKFPIVTSAKWTIGCLPTLANAKSSTNTLGEGFLAVAPDGTKYRFDWMVRRAASELTKTDPSSSGVSAIAQPAKEEVLVSEEYSSAKAEDDEPPSPMYSQNPRLQRTEVWIMPTKVMDRVGNSVTYTYDPIKPENLISIEANDGRKLTLEYETIDGVKSNRITSVTDGVRTWEYSYRGLNKTIEKVTLPDNSYYDFSEADDLFVEIGFQGDPGKCSDHKTPFLTTRTGLMRHPSGATGTFTLNPVEHGRSNVQEHCNGKNLSVPIFYFTNTLTQKSISGPGLSTADWKYSFGAANGSFDSCGATCVKTETVEVTNPDGAVTRYTFGNQYGIDEGRLQRTDIGWDGASALRTTHVTYNPTSPSNPYPAQFGTSPFAMGDGGTDARLYPEKSRITTQQGVTFSQSVNEYDSLARPLKVTRASSLGHSKMIVTEYTDFASFWTLGLVKRTTERDPADPPSWNVLLQDNTFHTNGYLLTSESMGVKQTYQYNSAPSSMIGTLKSIDDGKAQLTSFSNYQAGLPQTITYPDLRTEKATITTQGFITSTTDAAGNTYTFQPDAMLRVATIQPPALPTVGAHPTQITFTPISAVEKNIAAGHWRQDVTTGTARTRTYFDAMWRPLVSEMWDDANAADTRRVIWRAFDIDGKEVFSSYPARDFSEDAYGVATKYDALGRPVTSIAHSELGNLTTSYDYLDGFRKSVTDPRGHTSITSLQAFGEPAEDAITSIALPRGIQVSIDRHPWGATRSITRSDDKKSVTRAYVYDPLTRQLCKTIEPETGATIQKYDKAGNVEWRASGLNLLSLTTCDIASVTAAQKAVFTYDKLNRLLTTTFGDASPSITRTYTADGLPLTVNSGGANWTYGYNERRLLTTETLTYGTGSYKFIRDYNAYGAPTQLTYPDGAVITYQPNALGEPSEVGPYASLIKYHPSGAIESFTYGNGVKHTMKQNARGLPERATDANVLDDVYVFDENANVHSITDSKDGVTTRTMYYDELDRLTRVSAPGMWGEAHYDYDAIDNLTNSTITGGAGIARSMVHNYDHTNRLTSITGTSAFAVGIGYDVRGNINKRGAQNFVFDIANRMKEASGKATYLYDGHGRRISSVGNDSVNRIQVYSQDGQLLFTKPGTGAGTKYIYLKKHQIAEVAP